MKRVALVLVVVFLLGGLTLSAQTTVVKVKVQSANVRTQPDTNAAVIKQVKLGTLLESSGKTGDWWEVTVVDDQGTSRTAYIHANVVDIVSGAAAEEQAEAQPVREAAPVRSEPAVRDQEYAPAKVYPGGFKIMAAYGMASLTASNNSVQEYDQYKTSLMGLGGGVGFETGGMLGLDISVMYLPKGIRYKGTYDSGGIPYAFDMKMHINEISVPFLLKFNLPIQGINAYLLGGGEIAFIAQAKYDYEYTGNGQTQKGSEDIKKDLASLDYGLVLGGGIGLPLGGMNLVAEVRYHLGFADLNKNPEEGDPAVKSNIFLILAGFRF